jgi:hypothetical protein
MTKGQRIMARPSKQKTSVTAKTTDDLKARDQSPKAQEIDKAPRWQPIASFIVEFEVVENKDGSRQQRMTVQHIEADKNKIWWGIEPEESMRWMLAEAGIDTEPTPAVQVAPPPALPTQPVYPTGYSEKLQQVLAKTQHLSRTPLPANGASIQRE